MISGALSLYFPIRKKKKEEPERDETIPAVVGRHGTIHLEEYLWGGLPTTCS